MSARVFAPADAEVDPGAELLLEPEEAHYVGRVRRLRPGASLEVNDLRGGLWAGEVIEVSSRRCRVTVRDQVRLPPPPRTVAALVAVIDSKALLPLLAELSALGVEAVHLVRTERCSHRPPAPERIDRVLRASLRQSGRPLPPHVHDEVPLPVGLAATTALTGLIAAARGRTRLSGSPCGGGGRFLVGPEGGLTDDEIDLAVGDGLRPVTLGPWVLRTETAALSLAARMLVDP